MVLISIVVWSDCEAARVVETLGKTGGEARGLDIKKVFV